jgi:hypothetical protein
MSLKGLYLVIMCNLTHLQDGHTKVKFMIRIRILNRIRIRNQRKSKIRIRKKSFRIHNTACPVGTLFTTRPKPFSPIRPCTFLLARTHRSHACYTALSLQMFASLVVACRFQDSKVSLGQRALFIRRSCGDAIKLFHCLPYIYKDVLN